MKCSTCPSSAEGYAVIPGIGETGEIRFTCDRCARIHRMKMRYWDGRDLDMGGHRDNPDLGPSFHTLILSFQDLARMRSEDLKPVMEWVEDGELARALAGADRSIVNKVYAALPLVRTRRVRDLLERADFGIAALDSKSARESIVSVIKRL
jgi:hypothetical protein